MRFRLQIGVQLWRTEMLTMT